MMLLLSLAVLDPLHYWLWLCVTNGWLLFHLIGNSFISFPIPFYRVIQKNSFPELRNGNYLPILRAHKYHILKRDVQEVKTYLILLLHLLREAMKFCSLRPQTGSSALVSQTQRSEVKQVRICEKTHSYLRLLFHYFSSLYCIIES